MSHNKHVRSTVSGVLFLALVLFHGCYRSPKPLKMPSVYVDRPEVFTRERLVQHRIDELNWLRGKLEPGVYKATAQGYRDFRAFSGTMIQVAASLDPLGGALKQERSGAVGASLERQQELAEAKHKVDMAKYDRELERLEKPGAKVGELPTAAGLTEPTTAPTAEPPGLPSELAKGERPGYPSPADLFESKAELTSLESLRDELAFRNAVRAIMHENELDDTHDLHGYTLYTLKFDVSVLPQNVPTGHRMDEPAVVELKLPGKPSSKNNKKISSTPSAESCSILETDYQMWLQSVNDEMVQEAYSLQLRRDRGALTLTEQVRLYGNLQKAKEITFGGRESYEEGQKKIIEATRGLIEGYQERGPEAIGRLVPFPIDSRNYAGVPEPKVVNVHQTLALLVHVEYKRALKDYAVFLEAKDYLKVGEYFFKPGVVIDKPDSPERWDEAHECLNAYLTEERGKLMPYVYSVEPKEYAQNISDVAAKETFFALVVALKAAYPQAEGLDAGAFGSFVRGSEERLQAILRTPLVVGYAQAEDTFGWLLGPRFIIEEKEHKIGFRHAAAQHSLQATVAVPAWWPKLRIDVAKPYTKEHECFDVDLPRDPSALTAFLFEGCRTKDRRPPMIMPSSVGDDIIVHAGRKEELRIMGRDLWRSPAVFIGSQRADEVSILPDMKGLLATFNVVQMPGRYGETNPRVDLAVVTSNGPAILLDSVVVLPGPEEEAVRTVIVPEANCVIRGETLKLSATKGLIPRRAHGVYIRVRPTGKDEWYDLPDWAEVSETSIEKVIDLSVAQPTLEDENCELELDVQLRPSPSAPRYSIPKEGIENTVVYFMDQMSAHGSLETKKLVLTKREQPKEVEYYVEPNGNILIDLKDYRRLMTKAYPGLGSALESGFRLAFTDIDDKDWRKGEDFGVRLNARPIEFSTEYIKATKTTRIIIKTTGLTSKNAAAEPWIRWLNTGVDRELKARIYYTQHGFVDVDGTLSVTVPKTK